VHAPACVGRVHAASHARKQSMPCDHAAWRSCIMPMRAHPPVTFFDWMLDSDANCIALTCAQLTSWPSIST
jgi:hypothetical protein